MEDSFEKLRAECADCRKCALCSGRRNIVFGIGNEKSEIMFIGEGPGEKEDELGEPFVGPAGKLLDTMLYLIGLDRKDVYIANIVKCRPPGNRDPLPDERAACRDWLNRQIALLNPKIIVCLGRIAATSIIDDEFKITRDHGNLYRIGGRKVIASYHPSALLRDETKRPDAFVDFKKIQKELRSLNA